MTDHTDIEAEPIPALYGPDRLHIVIIQLDPDRLAISQYRLEPAIVGYAPGGLGHRLLEDIQDVGWCCPVGEQCVSTEYHEDSAQIVSWEQVVTY